MWQNYLCFSNPFGWEFLVEVHFTCLVVAADVREHVLVVGLDNEARPPPGAQPVSHVLRLHDVGRGEHGDHPQLGLFGHGRAGYPSSDPDDWVDVDVRSWNVAECFQALGFCGAADSRQDGSAILGKKNTNAGYLCHILIQIYDTFLSYPY